MFRVCSGRRNLHEPLLVMFVHPCEIFGCFREPLDVARNITEKALQRHGVAIRASTNTFLNAFSVFAKMHFWCSYFLRSRLNTKAKTKPKKTEAKKAETNPETKAKKTTARAGRKLSRPRLQIRLNRSRCTSAIMSDAPCALLVDPPAAARVRGENDHAALSADGVGSSLLTLSFSICRGVHKSTLAEGVRRVLADAQASSDVSMVKNLFVLAFQSRWCRGGKAEKRAFYQMIVLLYERFPDVVLQLVHLFPKYGYWKDLLSLLLECAEPETPLHAKVWSLFAEQLGRDLLELEAALREGRSAHVSLCAKYAPSEGGTHSKALKADKKIAELLFHGSKSAAEYRRMLSRLRKELEITESHMCAKRWTEIDFAKVPSLCIDRHKYAFLGEKRTSVDFLYPEDPVRKACRENFMEMLASGGNLKGRQLFPHELVAQVCAVHLCCLRMSVLTDDVMHTQVLETKVLSSGIRAVLNTQWAALREGVLEQLEARKKELALAAAPIDLADALDADGIDAESQQLAVLSISEDVVVDAAVSSRVAKPVGLSCVVPMVDVSGSMMGTPMTVAIALGIMVSEITHESFRHKIVTFHENPTWCVIDSEASFVEKVLFIKEAPWGMSTDFYAAAELICNEVREQKLGADQIPDLLVLSDMQFNEARKNHRSWDLVKDNIGRMFKNLGLELFGEPLEPPQLIFWNLRANTVGFPAASDDEGVVMLSGYSASLMKFVLSGEMTEETIVGVDAAGNAVKEKKKSNPEAMLYKTLHDSGLDEVRAVLDAMPAEIFLRAS